MRCRQGQATRRKRFKLVTLNIFCFYTFKNIRECQRGNASKAIDHCNIAIVSRAGAARLDGLPGCSPPRKM